MSTSTASTTSLRVSPLPEHRPIPTLLAAHPAPPSGQPTLFGDPATELSSTPPADGVPSLPDAAPTAAALVRLVLETLAGRRATAQLSAWFSEEVLAELVCQRGLRRRSRRHPPLLLHSVRVQHPRPDVAEASIHLRGHDRSLAWALRLEARRQRWICTCLELGPVPRSTG